MNEYKKQILCEVLELQMEYDAFNLLILGDEVHISDEIITHRIYKSDKNEIWDGFLQFAKMKCLNRRRVYAKN